MDRPQLLPKAGATFILRESYRDKARSPGTGFSGGQLSFGGTASCSRVQRTSPGSKQTFGKRRPTGDAGRLISRNGHFGGSSRLAGWRTIFPGRKPEPLQKNVSPNISERVREPAIAARIGALLPESSNFPIKHFRHPDVVWILSPEGWFPARRRRLYEPLVKSSSDRHSGMRVLAETRNP